MSEEERNQILQTIDMFEVITQTQPDDYQSLDILKEAYTKVGRQDEALRASRKLAEAYFNAGSYALAMQECEVLLVRDPNAPEVLAMLGEIEAKLQAAGQTMTTGGATHGLVAKAYGQGQGGGLVFVGRKEETYNLHERGDDQLAKFLIVQQIVSEDHVNAALEKPVGHFSSQSGISQHDRQDRMLAGPDRKPGSLQGAAELPGIGMEPVAKVRAGGN